MHSLNHHQLAESLTTTANKQHIQFIYELSPNITAHTYLLKANTAVTRVMKKGWVLSTLK
jgi:hypothetical protein